jgi:hypothetical protein
MLCLQRRACQSLLARVLVMNLLLPALSYAGLFDAAKKAGNVQIGQADSSGFSIRGGVDLRTGQAPGTATLFRNSFQAHGGSCSLFDFRDSMKEAFERFPAMFEALVREILDSIPMLALCYASPTLCDLGKHFQALMNALIQAKFAQCQSVQNSMAYAGLRLHGGQVSQCLEEQTGRGIGITEALDVCNRPASSLRLPDGSTGIQANLVQDLLATMGAPQETQVLAHSLVGEVTVRTGNAGLQAALQHPQAAMLALYEQHRAEADAALRAAVDEYVQTGTITPATLQSLAVPGQTVPRVAVEALAGLQGDPARYENAVGKVSTQAAIVQLTWEVHQLQEELTAATSQNQQITDEQRRLIEQKLALLQRTLAQQVQKVEVTERYTAALDGLLRDLTALQAQAARVGLSVPTLTLGGPSLRYQRQLPMGWGR